MPSEEDLRIDGLASRIKYADVDAIWRAQTKELTNDLPIIHIEVQHNKELPE